MDARILASSKREGSNACAAMPHNNTVMRKAALRPVLIAASLTVCVLPRKSQMLCFGATRQGDYSFPLTEVCNLDPARMFRAALTSRSCSAPQAEQHHRLTTSCLGPLGPLRHPQLEQARVVNRSLTMTTDLPACSPLYCSICLSIPQPLSSTAFAIRVFTS